MSPEIRIPAYFSHSYRPEDRDLNEFFWKLFWENDFSFTVDPQSETLSIPHLEMMMRWSACFVAVVTHRPQQPFYKSSPFIVYEYGLAVRAQKPRLIFVETGVPSQYFSEFAVTVAFDRRRLPERRTEFQEHIRRLASKSRAYSSISDRPRGPAGLILPTNGMYREARGAIGNLLSAAGHEPRELGTKFDNAFQFALQLDLCDFVVVDVGARSGSSWIYPFLQGRFIPTVRLLHQADSSGSRKNATPLDSDSALRAVGVKDEVVIQWRSTEDLTVQLERQVEKLFQPRLPFQSETEGQRYFRSLGRRQMSIFISNAAAENRFAGGLVSALNLENINPFHYVYDNQFELGKDWRESLKGQLRSTQVFVPLISASYWRSEWCQEEYKVAESLERRQMLTVYPYFLDDSQGQLVPPHGRKLSHLSEGDAIKKIVTDIDDFLTGKGKSEETATGGKSASGRSSRRVTVRKESVDIAIITVLPEEYSAMRNCLARTSIVSGTSKNPNDYSWEIGEIASDRCEAPYRVVLGMAGQPGEGSGLKAVMDTIDAFTTDYLLLVGVAGGLGGLRRGDVVVSDYIYGYEYGKADGGFTPRPEWVFAADNGMANAAKALGVRSPLWGKNIAQVAPDGRADPIIRVGSVASGNKVIDDVSDPTFAPVLERWPKLMAIEMEGLGAARAIEWAKQKGYAVNFSMVRGISDLPRDEPSETIVTADGHISGQTQERDLWKKYASAAAASLTTQIIRESWRVEPKKK